MPFLIAIMEAAADFCFDTQHFHPAHERHIPRTSVDLYAGGDAQPYSDGQRSSTPERSRALVVHADHGGGGGGGEGHAPPVHWCPATSWEPDFI